jgi:hypothetical protein
MEYKQITIGGVTMTEYSLHLEREYSRPVLRYRSGQASPVIRYHREALLEVFGWPYDEAMAQFPFYDLDNDDLQYLIDDY